MLLAMLASRRAQLVLVHFDFVVMRSTPMMMVVMAFDSTTATQVEVLYEVAIKPTVYASKVDLVHMSEKAPRMRRIYDGQTLRLESKV